MWNGDSSLVSIATFFLGRGTHISTGRGGKNHRRGEWFFHNHLEVVWCGVLDSFWPYLIVRFNRTGEPGLSFCLSALDICPTNILIDHFTFGITHYELTVIVGSKVPEIFRNYHFLNFNVIVVLVHQGVETFYTFIWEISFSLPNFFEVSCMI